ncbi:MAG: MBL fold metallo-hydrolase [Armatimonadetes bacterium]|nr:MAG: MBL fold metallo-hydrolase [Armatimonadota bacterium]
MTTIKRLTDSCVHVVTDTSATLFDPGFHSFLSGEIDLDSIGEVTTVAITHEHGDHVHPDFVRWLIDRGKDVAVLSNQAVADLLAPHDIEVSTDTPDGFSVEDVLHGMIPNGSQPPNRAFTVDGVFTHPGDSREPSSTAPVLALPIIVPWDTAIGAVEFARRVRPAQVVPIHDFYMSESGRSWTRSLIKGILADDGIELLDLDWGDTATV